MTTLEENPSKGPSGVGDTFTADREEDNLLATGANDFFYKRSDNIVQKSTRGFSIINHHQSNIDATAEEESKIDIQEHLLAKEKQVNSISAGNSETTIRRLFHEFIRSLNSPCDLCDSSNPLQRVITLNQQERLTAAVVVRKSLKLGVRQKKIIFRRVPKQACNRCFTRIVLLQSRLKDKYLERKFDMERSYTHGFKCRCISCQSQYGQLHLIVTGMESLSSDMLGTQPTLHNASQSRSTLNLDGLGGPRGFQIPEGQQVFQNTGNLPRPDESSLQDTEGHFHHNISSATTTMSYSHNQLSQQSFETYSSGYPVSNPNAQSNMEPTNQQPCNYQSSCGQREEAFSVFSRTQIPANPQKVPSQRDLLPYSGFSVARSSHSNIADRFHVVPDDQPSTSGGYRGKREEICYQSFSSSDSSRQSNLPVMLQDFEERSQIDITSNLPGQSRTEEETSPKKTKGVCRYCQKQFNHTGDFNKHLRKHTKEKPFSCQQCYKRFSHTSNLHRHERSHSGNRPYRCEFCNKEFNRKDKLDSHKKSKSCKNKRKDE